MSDIAALAGLAERGYGRTAENISNIGEQLGDIYRGRATKTVEQDALDFFQNGVTIDKLREFSAKYPNYPQQEIWKVATQVGSQSEANQAKNIFNDFVKGIHNGTIGKSEKDISNFFTQHKDKSPGALNTSYTAITQYLKEVRPDLKSIPLSERGVQYDRFGNVVPAPGLEAVEKPVMTKMSKIENGIVRSIEVNANDQEAVMNATQKGYEPGEVKDLGGGQWGDFLRAFQSTPKNKGKTAIDAMAAYENLKIKSQPDKEKGELTEGSVLTNIRELCDFDSDKTAKWYGRYRTLYKQAGDRETALNQVLQEFGAKSSGGKKDYRYLWEK